MSVSVRVIPFEVSPTEASEPVLVEGWDSPNTLTVYADGKPVRSRIFASPQVVWNGTQYVEYIFDPVAKDEFWVQCPRVAVHIKSSDVRIYNANMTEEVASKTVWELWKSDKNKTKEVGVKSQTFNYETFDESVRIVESQVMNDGSILNITYDFANFGKYSIDFKAGDNATYKVLWHVEIPKATKHLKSKAIDVANKVDRGVTFLDELRFLLYLGWEDAIEYFNETIIEPLGSGEKVNVVFAEREFFNGELLSFDPNYYSEPSLDGFIEKGGQSYPPNESASANTEYTALFCGQAYVEAMQWFYQERGYVSFDTSSIPDDAEVLYATLYLKTTTIDYSYVDFYVEVHGGSQPIYKSSLTADDWDCGTEYQNQWHTSNWQANTWVSWTNLESQVNKQGRTQFELKSSREGTTPYTFEYTPFYTADSSYDPYISITYSYEPGDKTLTMLPVYGSGTTTPDSPGNYGFDEGTQVNLTATTDYIGWTFDCWTIDGQNYTQNPTLITMDQDHTVKAYFKERKATFKEVKDATIAARGYLDWLAKNITYNGKDYTVYSEYPALPVAIYVQETEEWRLAGDWGSPPGEWLYPFQYRKNHTIIGSTAGAVSNYTIRVTAHYGYGSDDGEHVYLHEACRTDFADVRFTNSSGIRELGYWIEKVVTGDYAIFWVKIDSIPASPNNATICLYYGKEDSITTSNPVKTFIIWDDFEDYDVGDAPASSRGWSTGGTGANDKVEIANNPSGSGKVLWIKDSGDSVSTKAIVNFTDPYDPIIIGYKYRTGDNAYSKYHSGKESGSSKVTVRWYLAGIQWYNGASYQSFSPSASYAPNTWYTLEHKIHDSSEDYVDLVKDSTTHEGDWRATPTNGIDLWEFGLDRFNENQLWIDEFYVRKFIDPEPTHGEWIGNGTSQDQTSYTKTLTPTKDSWVDQSGPTSNFGDDDYLQVMSDDSGGNRRIFIEFDTSEIPDNIALSTVKLYLYCTNNYVGHAFDYNIHRVTESWTESGITWNNQPDKSSDFVEGLFGSGTGVWKEYDLSDLIMCKEDLENGLLLKYEQEGSGTYPYMWFYSRDYSEDYRPKLNVTYLDGTFAQRITSPTKDAYIDKYHPENEYGGVSRLSIYSGPSSTDAQRSLVEFNISTIGSVVSIENATLRLYCYDTANGRTYVAQRISGSWTEAGVNWNNQPSVSGDTETASSPSSVGWWEIEVTDVYVQDDVIGFRIKDQNENPGSYYSAEFRSKEYSIDHPELLVYYTESMQVGFFYNDTVNGDFALVDSLACEAEWEKIRLNFETDDDWDYDEPIVDVTVYHNNRTFYVELDASGLDSGRTVDVYLGGHEIFSNIASTDSQNKAITGSDAVAIYNDLRSFRYRVRHTAMMGIDDAWQRQLTDRLSRLQCVKYDFGFSKELYDPAFFYGRDEPINYFYTEGTYHDCNLTVYNQLPAGPTYYPYHSEAVRDLQSHIESSRNDPLARCMQAVHSLNQYGDPDLGYWHSGKLTTPRLTARWCEEQWWNGHGIRFPLGDHEIASGTRTAAFMILETLLGYEHNDATSKEFADRSANILLAAQWPADGWGKTQDGASILRHLHANGFMVAWTSLGDVAYGVLPMGILGDLTDLFGMPIEYDGSKVGIATNAETTFICSRALQLYSQHAYSLEEQTDIPSDRYVLQHHMFKDTGSTIKYMKALLNVGNYTVRVSVHNWSKEEPVDRIVKLYIDDSQVGAVRPRASWEDYCFPLQINSTGTYRVGLSINTSDTETPDNWWVGDLSIYPQKDNFLLREGFEERTFNHTVGWWQWMTAAEGRDKANCSRHLGAERTGNWGLEINAMEANRSVSEVQQEVTFLKGIVEVSAWHKLHDFSATGWQTGWVISSWLELASLEHFKIGFYVGYNDTIDSWTLLCAYAKYTGNDYELENISTHAISLAEAQNWTKMRFTVNLYTNEIVFYWGTTYIRSITASALGGTEHLVFILGSHNRMNQGSDKYWIKSYWDDCFYGYAS